jgi:hypothetical protein
MCVRCFSRTAGLALAILLIAGVPAFAARGVVAYRQSGCDYFVVATARGSDLYSYRT